MSVMNKGYNLVTLFVLLSLTSILLSSSCSDSKENRIVEEIVLEHEDTLFYDIFRHYRLRNLDSALKYADLGFEQALELEDTLLAIKSLNALGYCQYRKRDYETALSYYHKAVELTHTTNNPKRRMWFYNSMGNVFDDIPMFDSAMIYYHASLQLAIELDRDKDISIATNNIGNIFFSILDYESALDYYLESIKIDEEYGFYDQIELNYFNAGLIYNDTEKYQTAIEYFQKVIERCESNDCEPNYPHMGYYGLGIAYLGLKQYEKAKQQLLRSMDSIDLEDSISVYRNLSHLYLDLEQPDKALSYIDSSIFLATSIGKVESLEWGYKQKSEVLNNLGVHDSAYIYLQYSLDIQDSIRNVDVIHRIRNLMVELERDKADSAIQVKQDQILAKNRINLLLIAVIILAIAVIALIILDVIKRQRRNKYLNQIVSQRTGELRKSHRNLIERTKDLDNLIYNISHKVRGPMARLLGLINLGNMGQPLDYVYLRNEAYEVEKILQRLIIVSNTNHHKVKKEIIDTSDYFQKLLDNTDFMWREKISINLELNGVSKIKTDTLLLDIALENMIENSVKYSKISEQEAPTLNIKLENGIPGRARIILEDNGVGFDEKYKDSITELFVVANESRSGAGLGLFHAKFALDKMDCDMEVESTRNPTRFVIDLH